MTQSSNASKKHVAVHGLYAAWRFRCGEDQYLYHQMAPQLYHPVDAVAPFVVAAAAVKRPTSFEDLRAGNCLLPVPGASGPVSPRFDSTESWRNSAKIASQFQPPCEPIVRFDALLWAYWEALHYGPYTLRRRPGAGGLDRPAGAALVWEFVDNGPDVLVGFTAYDKNGLPYPWLTVSPCPAEEFAVAIRTDDTLSSLAGL